ncbi:MAG: hypothetical protein ACHP78_03340 [Terriglobales bacterium]
MPRIESESALKDRLAMAIAVGERDRIDQAISAIEAVNSTERHTVRRLPKAARKVRRRGRMSAAARRKMSRLMKQRWAQGKMKPAKASRPARRMNRAARKRIAAAQRARWAKFKAQQREENKAA